MIELCPECSHERGKPRPQPLSVRLLGLRPRPATCRVEESNNPSGYAVRCGCRAPFHGS